MEYTAENFEKVVNLFYRSEAGQQAQAHQWLTEAQNSPQAWSFVWELLQPQRTSEVQFFAATTLHTKLLKYWNEVPNDHYEQLKEKILENIINYAMGPKIILNRLCITLSAYVIHTIPNHWPNAFEELVTSFQPQNLPNIESERVIWILLEILTVIPEELQSTNLPTTQKNRVRTVLQSVSRDILKVIEVCLLPAMNENFNTNNLTTYLNSARCAATWLQFGGVCVSDCGVLAKYLIELVCKVYWNRQDPDGMSTDEIDVTEAAMEALTAMISHPYTHKYPSIVIRHLTDMLDNFMKIIEVEQNKKDQNKDIVTSIYNVIITTADTHSKLLIQNLLSDRQADRELSLLVFRAILNCSNLPGTYPIDETSSTLTFGFWYTLQDDILSLDEQQFATCLTLIKPFYRELVSVMLRKSMYPSADDDVHWTADDREVFRCYRQDIADTMMYCYNVMSVELLDILTRKLNEAIDKCKDNDRIVGENWPYIEASLHGYYAVAECIDYEDTYLPKLMLILKDIPYSELHTKVLATALDTFGAYAEWITEHPAVLEHVIPFLTSGLANPEVSPSATMALKDLTNNCQKYLVPFSNHILHACQSALQNGMLKLGECIRLMFSIGKVLSIMPIPNIMEYLNVILTPYFEEIQLLVSVEQSSTVATTIITRLKMLSALYCALRIENLSETDGQQPVLVVMQCTLPLYKEIANKWCKNLEVMDVLCTMLKHAVTTLMEDCKPLTNDILQLLVSSYRDTPQACILNVAKQFLIMFGKEETYAETMQTLMYELVSVTLCMCACLTENGSNQLSNHGDVLECFFITMSQITKKNPRLLLARGVDITAVFHCATVCLTMPEVQVFKACASFLTNFISQSREISLVHIVQNCGEQLVLRILLNLGGAAPRSAVEPMADLLLVLNKKYCDNLARWLNNFLSQEGFPSSRITKEQKELFIKTVLREKANKRKLTDSVLEFTLICRGILRPENTAV